MKLYKILPMSWRCVLISRSKGQGHNILIIEIVFVHYNYCFTFTDNIVELHKKDFPWFADVRY